jgi:hypothetical protein
VLTSFDVRGFRAFSRLRIERLGRVNLVVGKNNVGKSTLLEALWIYAAGGRPEAIQELLVSRQEIVPDVDPEAREAEVEVRALFHGRSASADEVRLGPCDSPDKDLEIRIGWLERLESSDPSAAFNYIEISQNEIDDVEGEVIESLIVSFAGAKHRFLRRGGSWSRALRRLRYGRPELGVPFLKMGGADHELIGKWWDSIALSPSEDRVINCLNLLAPIDGIKLIEHPRRMRERIIVARLRNSKGLQSLKSLGGGVERLFQTTVALEYAGSGVRNSQRELFESDPMRNILLVDEIETGIHYTALEQYWAALFNMARSHDVQVFATTHSWDCIQAFQQAASDDKQAEGCLIRIERKDGKSRAVVFDERELEIVTRDNIEVR